MEPSTIVEFIATFALVCTKFWIIKRHWEEFEGFAIAKAPRGKVVILLTDCHCSKSQTQNLSNVRVRARLIEKHSLVKLCARLPEIQTFKLAIDDVALDQVFNLSPELVRKPHTDVVVVDDQLLGTILQKRVEDRVYRPKINGVIGKQTV
jgi:hypothetical protein